MTEPSNTKEEPAVQTPSNKFWRGFGISLLWTALVAVIFTFTWNQYLTPMFTSIPQLKYANVLIIFWMMRVIFRIIFYDFILDIKNNLVFYRTAAEVINANMTSQGQAIIKLLNLINQKELTVTVVESSEELEGKETNATTEVQ